MIYPRVTISPNTCCRSTRYLLTAFVFLSPFGTVSAIPPDLSVRVEVFTATGYEVVDQGATKINEKIENVDLQVYELNRIQLVEVELSMDLPPNPDQSKRLAIQRIQILDDQARTRMQRSAIGLARAMQYGIDRYPAIVFDGQAVVYGVTDLEAAFAHYQTWKSGVKP